MNEILRRPGRQLVHHFHARRDDARANDFRHTVAGLLAGRETRQHGAHGFRAAQNSNRHLANDPQESLGAGQQPQHIVATGIQMLTAESHDLALDGHQFDAQHIISGQTVFQAMNAAGILGDIAADGAGDLARRIGRIVETLVLDRVGDAQVGDTGLRHDTAVVEIDFQNTVEFCHRQQHAIGQRKGAARQ